MTSAVHDMYRRLENCVEGLEKDVKKSLEEVTGDNFDHNVIALETSKDYHYKEILDHVKQIKDHIKIIADHNKSLQLLQNKINGTKIDKNYIKKQVETFQKMGIVNRRERKPVRPRETSSMKLLECWEKLMEEQQAKESTGNVFSVPKRTNNVRKNKRVVSSTVDMFLDSSRTKSLSLDLLIEETTNSEDIPVIKKCVSSDSLVMQRPVEHFEAINEAVTRKVLVEDDEEIASEERLDSLCNKTTSTENVQGAAKSDSSDSPNANNASGESVVDAPKTVSQKGLADDDEESSSDEKTLEKIDTKPRIVEVIYKKNTNGHIPTQNH